MTTLGQSMDTLLGTIAARASADPKHSYTAFLLTSGPQKCAKKLGEEAVEAALACVGGDKAAFAEEAADVLFHLFVALQVAGVPAAQVAAVLEKRQAMSGHEEKAARSGQ